MYGRYGVAPGPRYRDVSACMDTLGGSPFSIYAAYDIRDSVFHVAAVPESPEGSWTEDVRCWGPDSADQNLFLAIIRSIREDSRTALQGTVFLGGHRLSPPYRITDSDGNLAVNGYALPDSIPNFTRAPDPSGELEARRSIVAALVALRDSIPFASTRWAEAQRLIKERALLYPFVDSVVINSNRVTVCWGFGFNVSEIPKKTPAYSFGDGRLDGWQTTERFYASRLDHLKALLDDGSVLFLLGGGCEYVVKGDQSDAVLAAVGTLRSGQRLSRAQSHLLPGDVRAQLLSPLTLRRVK